MAIGRSLHRGAAEGAAVAGEAPTRPSTGRRRPGQEPAADSWRGQRCRTTAGCGVVQQALRAGATVEEVHEATGIDPWFLDQIELLNEVAAEVQRRQGARPRPAARGPSGTASPTRSSAGCAACREDVVRGVRHALGIRPVYKTVDTCAAEFAAPTPYHYSSYDEETEVAPRAEPAVLILGSGPNRIGQGIEFDYSCVHASLRAARRRLRDRDGQLQPGDGLDRLRHLRPALLRAAHPRGRARGRARRAAGRAGRRRHRAARRADPARPGAAAQGRRACRSSAPAPRRSTSPRTAARSAEVLAGAGLPAPKHGTATSYDEAPAVAADDRLPGAGAAVVRARRPRHGDRLRRRAARRPTWPRRPRCRPTTRCWSTGSSTTRSRSTSTRCSTATSSTSAA